MPKNTRSTLKIKEDTVWSKKTGPAFYVVKYHRFDKDWYLGEDSLVEDFEEAKAMDFQEAKDYAYDFIDGLFIENEVPSYILEEMAEDEKKDYDDWDELAKSSCGLVDDYPARKYILGNMEVVPIYANFQESKRKDIDRFEDWYLGEQAWDRVPPSIKKADNIIRKYLGKDPFKNRMTPREAFQALPEEGKAEINAYLDQILGVELGESKKFSEHYNDPDLLDELVNYYASFDTMSTAEIWEEIYAKYKDEALADEVIESLENDNPYDQEDEDFYEDHAEEWLNRHPHGWYNSESDYGVDWEDQDLPYVGPGNPDWELRESVDEPYYILRTGESIGTSDVALGPYSHDDAIEKAKRYRKLLTPGEKEYYNIKYKVISKTERDRMIRQGRLTESTGSQELEESLEENYSSYTELFNKLVDRYVKENRPSYAGIKKEIYDKYHDRDLATDVYEAVVIIAAQRAIQAENKLKAKMEESSEFDYSGWKKEDIELHKKIDWEARDYKEYIVPGTEYEGTTRFYTEDGLKIVKEAYAKRLRVNFPPYYGPVDNTSTKKWTSAMYDGRTRDGYDVHDRRESWEVYRALSEKRQSDEDFGESEILDENFGKDGWTSFKYTKDGYLSVWKNNTWIGTYDLVFGRLFPIRENPENFKEKYLKESTNLAQRYMDFYNDNSHYNEDGIDGDVSRSEDIIHKYLGDKMYDMDIDAAVDALPLEGKIELMAYLDKLEYGYLEEDYDREKKVLDLFKEDVDDFIGVTTKVCLDPRHGYYLYASANRIAYHAFVLKDEQICLQINEIHPYDDADYYSAHCKNFIDSDMWDFNLNGRIKFSKMCTSIDEVLATLKEKNKNIKPRMMHN